MHRFVYAIIYLHIHKFAHVCKSVHVNAFTHVSKIYSICKSFSFAPSQDQMQIFICIYFTHMQILSCERKVKFAYMCKFINYVILTLFQRCVSSRIIASNRLLYHFYSYGHFQLLQIYIHFFKFAYKSIRPTVTRNCFSDSWLI